MFSNHFLSFDRLSYNFKSPANHSFQKFFILFIQFRFLFFRCSFYVLEFPFSLNLFASTSPPLPNFCPYTLCASLQPCSMSAASSHSIPVKSAASSTVNFPPSTKLNSILSLPAWKYLGCSAASSPVPALSSPNLSKGQFLIHLLTFFFIPVTDAVITPPAKAACLL